MKIAKEFGVGIIYLSTISFLMMDVYGNINRVKDLLGVDSAAFMFLGLVGLLVLRFKGKSRLSMSMITINNLLVLPIGLLAGSLLALVDFFTSTNFVFSQTLLNHQRILIIGIFGLICVLINLPRRWIKKNFFSIELLSVPTVWFIFFVISLWPFDVFQRLVYEDALVENLQELILAFCMVTTFKIAYKLYRTKGWGKLAILFTLMGVVIIGVALEEISWGQRILQVTSPSFFVEKNLQQETNLHNLIEFSITQIGYVVFGLVAGLAWLLVPNKAAKKPKIKELKKNWLGYLIPSRYTCVHFLVAAVYFSYTAINLRHGITVWGEVIELILYLGMAMYLVERQWLVVPSAKMFKRRKS